MLNLNFHFVQKAAARFDGKMTIFVWHSQRCLSDRSKRYPHMPAGDSSILN